MLLPSPSATAIERAETLISLLPASSPGLTNPYQDGCAHDAIEAAALARRRRLAAHLDTDPALILVGEAMGYAGARYTGVAFSSEKLLLQGALPRIPAPGERITARDLPFSEPSATLVWQSLYLLGMADRAVIWNAVHVHPHRPGEPWSNRTPSRDEQAQGLPALKALLREFPDAEVIAIGRRAEESLERLGRRYAGVRHPAYGGATAFAEGLRKLVSA